MKRAPTSTCRYAYAAHANTETAKPRTLGLAGCAIVAPQPAELPGAVPGADRAYNTMKDLQFVVSSGVFLRNLHRWSAHAMVLLPFAHLFKVFYRGAYRPPREFNWVIGVVLLLLTLFLSYTGYLLPWDQLAFWAITVGSNIASAVPVLGSKIRFLMLGGNQVNANALLRFYVLHCMILPLTAIFFIAIHFWRVQKDGGLTVREDDERKE